MTSQTDLHNALENTESIHQAPENLIPASMNSMTSITVRFRSISSTRYLLLGDSFLVWFNLYSGLASSWQPPQLTLEGGLKHGVGRHLVRER